MIGDFNYDGRVNLSDWAILNNVNPAMAAAAMSLIQSVPEPTTLTLGAFALAALAAARSRVRNTSCAPSRRSQLV